MSSITLDDAREYLQIPAAQTSFDPLLLSFIDAADEELRSLVGEVVPTEYVEMYDGGETSIFLRRTPVIQVASVVESWGWTTFSLDFVDMAVSGSLSMYAYSLDDAGEGAITRRTANITNPIAFFPGQSNIQVTYTAGRDPVPSIIQLAAKELVRHWFIRTQQRAGVAEGQYTFDANNQDQVRGGPDAGMVPINAGIPNSVIEMIRPYRRAPIFG